VTRHDPENPDEDDGVDGEADGNDDEAGDGAGFAIVCPYCGEPDTLFVDQTQPAGSVYVEDCTVCCQPMTVTIVGDAHRRRVQVDRD
jgi:hypothetical protein